MKTKIDIDNLSISEKILVVDYLDKKMRRIDKIYSGEVMPPNVVKMKEGYRKIIETIDKSFTDSFFDFDD